MSAAALTLVVAGLIVLVPAAVMHAVLWISDQLDR